MPNPSLDLIPEDPTQVQPAPAVTPNATSAPQLNLIPESDTATTPSGKLDHFFDALLEAALGPPKQQIPALSPNQTTIVYPGDPTSILKQLMGASREGRRRAVVKAGSYAAGGPFFGPLLAATSNTPSDLATNVALSGAGPLLRAVGPGGRVLTQLSRPMSTALGVGKGLGAYEGGKELHSYLDNRPAPPLFSLNDPLDLAGAVFSGLLGGAEGASRVPKPPKPINVTDAKLANDHANDALRDAEAALAAHESTVSAQQKAALGAARRAFNTRQQQFTGEQKTLSFSIDDMKKRLSDIEDQLQEHQGSMADQKTAAGQETAEQLADRILQLQRRLDGIRNPQTRDSFMTSPDEQALQDKINKFQNQIDNAPNEGIAAQNQKALEQHQTILDSLRELNTKTAVDETNAALRQLRVQQRRMNQGRFDMIPTDADLAAGKKVLDLKQSQADTQKALDELIRQHRQSQLDQIAHATTAPGATTADVNTAVQGQKLEGQVQAAREAFRQARDQYTRAQGTGRSKAQGYVDTLMHELPYILIGGTLDRATGGSGVLGGAAAELFRGLIYGARHTPEGQRALGALERNVAPVGTQAIPALVNAHANQ